MPSVILFRPAYDRRSRSAPVFPWALLYLASVLRERGVEVHILDEAVTADYGPVLDRLLERARPVAVGVTTMTGDQIRCGLEFARRVRAKSPAAIVWGGIHPSLLPEQTARHPLVDYAVAGEGEYALAELVDRLAAAKDAGRIPGVYGKNGGARRAEFIDLSQLPEIPYDLADVEKYISARPDLEARRYFEICTSRGCPHHCGFCYIESVHGSRWRALDAAQALEKIRGLAERFNLDCVSFREDNFFVNRGRVEAIARGLIENGPRIKWAASCRINYFDKYDDAFIDLLKSSGCVLLTFGVESGNDRVLEFIRKGIKVEAVVNVARRVQAAGIRGTYHFMGGFPTETADEFIDTCRLIDRLRRLGPDVVVREMSIFAPYPGVGLIPECVSRGHVEPADFEGWIGMDWANPQRPWLTARQSQLISDAQFLIARLSHPSALVRAWANARWMQLLERGPRMRLPERPAVELLRRLRGK
jgi:radical SAM superfamily enzyme YgiQ (UPF0313 family)